MEDLHLLVVLGSESGPKFNYAVSGSLQTIEKVKGGIVAAIPELKDKKLDLFTLSLNGEVLEMEFRRFLQLPAVSKVLESKEALAVTLTTKDKSLESLFSLCTLPPPQTPQQQRPQQAKQQAQQPQPQQPQLAQQPRTPPTTKKTPPSLEEKIKELQEEEKRLLDYEAKVKGEQQHYQKKTPSDFSNLKMWQVTKKMQEFEEWEKRLQDMERLKSPSRGISLRKNSVAHSPKGGATISPRRGSFDSAMIAQEKKSSTPRSARIDLAEFKKIYTAMSEESESELEQSYALDDLVAMLFDEERKSKEERDKETKNNSSNYFRGNGSNSYDRLPSSREMKRRLAENDADAEEKKMKREEKVKTMKASIEDKYRSPDKVKPRTKRQTIGYSGAGVQSISVPKSSKKLSHQEVMMKSEEMRAMLSPEEQEAAAKAAAEEEERKKEEALKQEEEDEQSLSEKEEQEKDEKKERKGKEREKEKKKKKEKSNSNRNSKDNSYFIEDMKKLQTSGSKESLSASASSVETRRRRAKKKAFFSFGRTKAREIEVKDLTK